MRSRTSSFARTGIRLSFALAGLGLALLSADLALASHFRGGNIYVAVAPDNGAGTVDLPSPATKKWTEDELLVMSEGLPAGSAIEFAVLMHSCQQISHQPPPAGTLGGGIDSFTATLDLHMHGTGAALGGFERTLHLPVQVEIHNAPRSPGDPLQSFDTEMFMMAGQLPPPGPGQGDPDFDVLRITAGSGFGMPSPGHTTLTRLPPPTDGDWAVDSFFDVFYRIDFVGAPGGALDGMQGTTISSKPVRLVNSTGDLPLAPLNEAGGVDTPAENIPIFGSGNQCFQVIDGLPPGQRLQLCPRLTFFECFPTGPSSLGGLTYSAQGIARVDVDGMEGDDHFFYHRAIDMPVATRLETSPFQPGGTLASFDIIILWLEAQLPPGDPDFDLLRIKVGTQHGLPNSGRGNHTLMPDGRWAVDSFFDISYEIEFTGAAGGPFAGMSGTSTGSMRLRQGRPLPVREVRFAGLPHSELGQAVVQPIDIDGDLLPDVVAIANIGSSGQDGVSIHVGGDRLIDWQGAFNQLGAGANGWSGGIDFGPSGNLPPGARLEMQARSFDEHGEPSAGPRLRIQEVGGGHASLSMEPCEVDLPCQCGPGCQPWCCPQANLVVQLLNDGVVVASHTYAPPYPPELVRAPLGSSLVDGAPPVLISTTALDTDGNGGLDRLVCMLSEPMDMPMQLVSSPGVVQADTIAISMALAGVPGLPWYPAFAQVDITAANIPELRLHDESVAHRQYIVQHNQTNLDFLMRAIGDVDGDGLFDLLLTGFDHTGASGVTVGAGDVTGDGVIDPNQAVEKIEIELLALDLVSAQPIMLPPDSSLEVEVLAGALVLGMGCHSGLATACGSSNYCPHIAMTQNTVGPDAWFDVYHNGVLVGSAPATPDNVVLLDTVAQPTVLEGRWSNSPYSEDAVRFHWTQVDGPITFSGLGMPSLQGDELRLRASPPRGGAAGGAAGGITALRISGDDLNELIIVDGEVTPLPPPCPADIRPSGGNGTVNVQDLLGVIASWGACPPPCPPCEADLAPPGGNCAVNVQDLLFVIANWGPCP